MRDDGVLLSWKELGVLRETLSTDGEVNEAIRVNRGNQKLEVLLRIDELIKDNEANRS